MRWQITAVLGVLSAVAMTAMALVAEKTAIEEDILTRAGERLTAESMSWAKVAIDGRDLRLEGSAPTPELRTMAVERIERTFGVRSLDAGGTGLLPEMAPYAVLLERRGGVLTISGGAPSAPDRSRMVAAFTAAVPDVAYNDRLRLQRGMPDAGFLETLSRLYPLLGDLAEGRISLVDRRVEISGRANSNAAYDRLSRLALDLPTGYSSGTPRIERPLAEPFLWSAEKDANGIRLSGYAPDPAVRSALFGSVRSGAADRPVSDHVDLAAGAPEGFGTAAMEAAAFLSQLEAGRVTIEGPRLAISGRPADPATWRRVTAALAAFRPAGYTVESAIELPVVSPYLLSAVRTADRLTVTGFVPSAEVDELIRTAARRVSGTSAVVVETALASGAPDRFAEAAVMSVTLLDDLISGSIAINGSDVAVAGTARNGTALNDLLSTVERVKPEGFAFDLDVDPPPASPYVWSLRKAAGTVTMTGAVPDEATRGRLLSILQDSLGGTPVADRTILASGQPADVDFARVAAFAADRLKAMSAGVVSMNDDNLSVNGAAATARDGQSVVNAFEGRLPRGLKRGIVQVDYPPAFQFRIERDGDRVTLAATVPDEAALMHLEETARRAFGSADLAVDVATAENLPDGSANMAVLLTRAAGLLASGSISVDHSVVLIEGRAYTGSGAVRMSSALAGALPRGFRLETALGVADAGPSVEPATCAALLDDLSRRNTIHFETGSAELSPDSHGYLDRIAMTLSRCRDARVTIEGHTDSVGDPTANVELSRKRALAVRKFLGDVGVDLARLQAEGFGDTRPVAGNETDADKAKNRRIEIRIIGTAP